MTNVWVSFLSKSWKVRNEVLAGTQTNQKRNNKGLWCKNFIRARLDSQVGQLKMSERTKVIGKVFALSGIGTHLPLSGWYWKILEKKLQSVPPDVPNEIVDVGKQNVMLKLILKLQRQLTPKKMFWLVGYNQETKRWVTGRMLYHATTLLTGVTARLIQTSLGRWCFPSALFKNSHVLEMKARFQVPGLTAIKVTA